MWSEAKHTLTFRFVLGGQGADREIDKTARGSPSVIKGKKKKKKKSQAKSLKNFKRTGKERQA